MIGFRRTAAASVFPAALLIATLLVSGTPHAERPVTLFAAASTVNAKEVRLAATSFPTASAKVRINSAFCG